MTTLAIVTSTPQVSVAVGECYVAVREAGRHGEVLAPAIEACMKLAGASMGEIERVAVDTGPGLFTGLRVGVATAKALASALGVPVVTASSLELIAHPHLRSGRVVVPLVDARRGEVFWALDGEMMVNDPKDVSERIATLEGDVLAAGDGARRYADLLCVDVAGPEFDHPSAAVLLELAAGRAGQPADEVVPTYLRAADVRIGWAKRDE